MGADSQKRRLLAVALVLALLDVALFAPLSATAPGSHDFFPFTPREHPGGAWAFDLRSAVEYGKALLLRRANLDIFRVSLEFLGLLGLTAAFPGRRWARWLAAVTYVVLLLGLTYHHAYAVLYRVRPALWEDVALLPSLLRYVSATFGWWAPLAIGLGIGGVLAGVLAMAYRVFGAWQRLAGRRAFAVVLALSAWGAVSLRWFGFLRDDPVMQVPSKFLVWNLEESVARRDRLLELRRSGSDPAYAFAQRARLERKPKVYLLMIEAYGQRLVSDPQLRGPFAQLAERVQGRLIAAGYSARTAFSASPVYGGKSWLSVATVQTGVRIETPSIYDEMAPRASELATFTEFFRSQGYAAHALLPGNYLKGMKVPDPYKRDRVLEYADLNYMGEHYGYVGVPDQHSLAYFRREVLAKEARPYLAFYLSISTHHPFPTIPFIGGPAWAPITDTEAIDEGMPRQYFQSVAYEWRCLLEFLEAESDPDAVFFVVGDHQPLLERTMNDVNELTQLQSSNTPVHVISKNQALVERFAKYGFVPGLFAEPGTGGLRHEGLSSLFIHELVGEYGGTAEQRFTKYYPEGIGLGGLVPP